MPSTGRSTDVLHFGNMAIGMTDYVFGYGSLVSPGGTGVPARLPGATRRWGVAMDNSWDLPGYKWYATPAGERPALFVCFLDVDLDVAPDREVNGVCAPVSDADLALLDARERNYARVDVSRRIGCGERVWTYVGSAAGRARFAEGVAAGRAVIARGYLDTVRAGFQALGPGEWEACAPSVDPAGLPVRELARRDL